jgi:hypothetical protein
MSASTVSFRVRTLVGYLRMRRLPCVSDVTLTSMHSIRRAVNGNATMLIAVCDD